MTKCTLIWLHSDINRLFITYLTSKKHIYLKTSISFSENPKPNAGARVDGRTPNEGDGNKEMKIIDSLKGSVDSKDQNNEAPDPDHNIFMNVVADFHS